MITSMGSAGWWIAMSNGALDPLDFVFVPSSMGQAPSLALGIALAQPDRRVFACNGDDGPDAHRTSASLATISAECPTNLLLIILDNGVYEVTGAIMRSRHRKCTGSPRSGAADRFRGDCPRLRLQTIRSIASTISKNGAT